MREGIAALARIFRAVPGAPRRVVAVTALSTLTGVAGLVAPMALPSMLTTLATSGWSSTSAAWVGLYGGATAVKVVADWTSSALAIDVAQDVRRHVPVAMLRRVIDVTSPVSDVSAADVQHANAVDLPQIDDALTFTGKLSIVNLSRLVASIVLPLGFAAATGSGFGPAWLLWSMAAPVVVNLGLSSALLRKDDRLARREYAASTAVSRALERFPLSIIDLLRSFGREDAGIEALDGPLREQRSVATRLRRLRLSMSTIAAITVELASIAVPVGLLLGGVVAAPPAVILTGVLMVGPIAASVMGLQQQVPLVRQLLRTAVPHVDRILCAPRARRQRVHATDLVIGGGVPVLEAHGIAFERSSRRGRTAGGRAAQGQPMVARASRDEGRAGGEPAAEAVLRGHDDGSPAGARGAPAPSELARDRPRHRYYIPHVRVEPCSTVAITGPSGAGKSTFAQLLSDRLDPRRGTLLVDGQDVRDHSLRSRLAVSSYVAQDAPLFGPTIGEALRLGSPRSTDAQLLEELEAIGLGELLQRRPALLQEPIEVVSGGERKRLATVVAAVGATPVVVLDEPTANLDPVAADHVRTYVARLAKRKTVVLVSHDAATVGQADMVLHAVDHGLHSTLQRSPGSQGPVRVRVRAPGWRDRADPSWSFMADGSRQRDGASLDAGQPGPDGPRPRGSARPGGASEGGLGV